MRAQPAACMDRRHFFQAALGTRHGITTEYGRSAEAVIDEIVARTPSVIAEVLREVRGG